MDEMRRCKHQHKYTCDQQKDASVSIQIQTSERLQHDLLHPVSFHPPLNHYVDGLVTSVNSDDGLESLSCDGTQQALTDGGGKVSMDMVLPPQPCSKPSGLSFDDESDVESPTRYG